MNRESVLEGARNLAALRRLDLVDAGAIVSWATEHSSNAETGDLLVRLASQPPSTDSQTVDSLLDELLRDLGDRPMDVERAGRLVAQMLAEKIIGGSIEPAVGARKIWWDVARKVPSLEPRLRIFVGLASGWEDSPDHRSGYEDDIVKAAFRLLDEDPGPGA